MYNSVLENRLIIVDIVDVMVDYCSLQPDLDETKAKAAELAAQKLDIQRIIGKPNLDRCITPVTDADKNLVDLITPTLCYFTYSRMLKMFSGTFTDSGYITEEEAKDGGVIRIANQYSAVAEVFIKDVVDFLELETPNNPEVKEEKINPRIRVFGGNERRASN